MDHNRIYEYRFRGVNKSQKIDTWRIISAFIYRKLNRPKLILDPAACDCEFINTVQAEEKWAVDMNESVKSKADNNIKVIVGNNLEVELPSNYFDGVFISNFLEHLASKEEVVLFLKRMHDSLKTGGYIAVMGPNFKYCYKNYFDFADHEVILTETGLAEHLYGAGFEIEKVYPQFLPLSFRGKLPVADILVKIYLAFPIFWKIFGKQFLVIARK